MEILPALPARSWESVETLANALKGVSKSFQLDIVDGIFAQPPSWPCTESEPLLALHRLNPITSLFEVELDLMVANPFDYLSHAVSVGARRVIVHIDSIADITPFADHAHAHGYELGLALMSTTARDRIERWLPQVDFVQYMGMAVVGAQGQPFDERVLGAIESLHQDHPSLCIEIDGSVNKDTILRLKEVGVTRFAVGSALSHADDPRRAYEELRALISEQ